MANRQKAVKTTPPKGRHVSEGGETLCGAAPDVDDIPRDQLIVVASWRFPPPVCGDCQDVVWKVRGKGFKRGERVPEGE
jgi:hypothetical protein